MMPLVHCTYACVISGKKKNTCWLNKNNFKSKYARGVNNYRFDCLSRSLSHSYIHIYNVCDVECKVSVFINKEEKREKRKRERGKEAGCLECQRRKSWGQEKKSC